MKLLFVALSALALTIICGCQSEEKVDSPGLPVEQLEKDTINLAAIDSSTNADSDDENQSVSALDEFLEKTGNRFYEDKIRVPYNRLDNRTAKHVFLYDDEFIALDINVNGISYFVVYECGLNDTLLRYVKVAPEIEMEGSFINYYNDPVHEYHFKNERLINIGFEDPKNKERINPYLDLSNARKVYIGDSIKSVVDNFLIFDDSTHNFNSKWNYVDNNDQYSFSIELNQVGSFVHGNYCAHTLNKYDCQNEDQGGSPCWVNGYSFNDTLYVLYKSCFADQQGNAKLYYENDTLVWKTIYAPEGSMVLGKGLLREITK